MPFMTPDSVKDYQWLLVARLFLAHTHDILWPLEFKYQNKKNNIFQKQLHQKHTENILNCN